MFGEQWDGLLDEASNCFKWSDIKQDLKSLQQIVIDKNGKSVAVRTQCISTCGKVYLAVGVAISSAIQEI